MRCDAAARARMRAYPRAVHPRRNRVNARESRDHRTISCFILDYAESRVAVDLENRWIEGPHYESNSDTLCSVNSLCRCLLRANLPVLSLRVLLVYSPLESVLLPIRRSTDVHPSIGVVVANM